MNERITGTGTVGEGEADTPDTNNRISLEEARKRLAGLGLTGRSQEPRPVEQVFRTRRVTRGGSSGSKVRIIKDRAVYPEELGIQGQRVDVEATRRAIAKPPPRTGEKRNR